MKFTEVLVTPEIAATYLAKNHNNRRLDMFHVRKLSKDIREGKWVLNGDTVRFDIDGNLIDGQHRLNAVIHSGVSIPMLVIEGIENPNAFKTIDTNAKLRNVGQILGLMGVKNSNLSGAIARRLKHYEDTVEKENFSLDVAAFRYISTQDIIQYLEKHEEEIQQMILRIKSHLVFKQCAAGTSLVTSLILCNRFDSEKTNEMIDILITGSHAQIDSPIIKLRDRLLTPAPRRGKAWDLEIMAIVVKAFIKFIEGKPARHLRWMREGGTAEKFPLLDSIEVVQEVANV